MGGSVVLVSMTFVYLLKEPQRDESREETRVFLIRFRWSVTAGKKKVNQEVFVQT